jgi:hypothetical protein
MGMPDHKIQRDMTGITVLSLSRQKNVEKSGKPRLM